MSEREGKGATGERRRFSFSPCPSFRFVFFRFPSLPLFCFFGSLVLSVDIPQLFHFSRSPFLSQKYYFEEKDEKKGNKAVFFPFSRFFRPPLPLWFSPLSLSLLSLLYSPPRCLRK